MTDTVLLSVLLAGQVFTWGFLSVKLANVNEFLTREIRQKGSRR